MSFYLPTSFLPQQSPYLNTYSNEELHYRRIAEEHQRRARAALALAQEEEHRRRGFRDGLALDDFPPTYDYVYPDNLRSREHLLRDEREYRMEEWLQRRRQRELEEAEFQRRMELERRQDEEMMGELLSAFGVEPRQPLRSATPSPSARSKACHCGHRSASPAARETNVPTASPPPTQQTSHSSSELMGQLWNTLRGGRSDEERANVPRELRFAAPFNASLQSPHTPTTASCTTTKPTAPMHPQIQPPKPTPVPIRVTTPASTTTTPSQSTSTRLSPFAHIESVQEELDSLRSSSPDLADGRARRDYVAKLDKLLTSLDRVESSGSESVRGARKALVRAVEEDLERVEQSGGETGSKMTDEDFAVQPAVEGAQDATIEAEVEGAEAQDQAEQAVAVQPIEAVPETPSPSQEAFAIAAAKEHEHSQRLSPVSTEEHTIAQPTAASSDDVPSPNGLEYGDVPRGRRSTVSTVITMASRPRSVEIEEVPDVEGFPGSPRSGYEVL